MKGGIASLLIPAASIVLAATASASDQLRGASSVLTSATTTVGKSGSSSKHRLMTWLCLEFCQETQEQIWAEIAQLEAHRDVVTAVSFEKYTLGPNCSLVDNHLTEVKETIVKLGFESWPLLSSYPHPVEFIDWMREVFRTPQPFIDQCLSEASKYGYTGYNLDWEPTDNVTQQDGLDYANFIQTFAKSLHEHGLKLSVDVATWSTIWNYTAIAETEADMVISMGTYTSSDSSFTKQLNYLVSNFTAARSGVGLEMVNASTGAAIPTEEVEWRFQQIEESGAVEVDIWRSPVPSDWWPSIRKFMRG